MPRSCWGRRRLSPPRRSPTRPDGKETKTIPVAIKNAHIEMPAGSACVCVCVCVCAKCVLYMCRLDRNVCSHNQHDLAQVMRWCNISPSRWLKRMASRGPVIRNATPNAEAMLNAGGYAQRGRLCSELPLHNAEAMLNAGGNKTRRLCSTRREEKKCYGVCRCVCVCVVCVPVCVCVRFKGTPCHACVIVKRLNVLRCEAFVCVCVVKRV